MEETPPMPQDAEQRNIIEKLALFVAKNGPDFETMTRQKQRSNPRFAFLFGGDFSVYYRYRLGLEIKQAQQGLPALSESNMQPMPPHANPDPAAEQQIDYEPQIEMIKKQISDSERNLKGQYDALLQQQQVQIDMTIDKLETEKLMNLANTIGIDIDAFSHVIDKLAETCTKDAISTCKHWIMENCQSDRLREIVLMYMLHRVKQVKATDQCRLHILYLINDWAHYCMRKKLDTVTQMISRYVPQLYAYAIHKVKDTSCKDKLDKLMTVWESQKYFDDNAYKQLRNPSLVYTNMCNTTQGEYQKVINEATQTTQITFQQYQQQHQQFEKHQNQQITALQLSAKHAQSGAQQKRRSRFDQAVSGTGPISQPPAATVTAYTNQPRPQSAQLPSIPLPPMRPSWRPNAVPVGPRFPTGANFPTPPSMAWPPTTGPPNMQQWAPRPGPGYPLPPKLDQSKLIPSVAYYDLPAGLMVPLVKVEDSNYKPLDPNALRLPPPVPPSERLIAAIEAFYAPPTIDNPRDSEGWEKNGLYEFYRAKQLAAQHTAADNFNENEEKINPSSQSLSP